METKLDRLVMGIQDLTNAYFTYKDMTVLEVTCLLEIPIIKAEVDLVLDYEKPNKSAMADSLIKAIERSFGRVPSMEVAKDTIEEVYFSIPF